jgi:hypothetical protein
MMRIFGLRNVHWPRAAALQSTIRDCEVPVEEDRVRHIRSERLEPYGAAMTTMTTRRFDRASSATYTARVLRSKCVTWVMSHQPLRKTRRTADRTVGAAILLLAVLTVFPAFAGAPTITGKLSIRGTLRLTGSAPTIVDFLPAGGGSGTFLVDPFTQTGSFVPFAGTTGSVKDLSSASGSVTLTNFLTLAANPSTSFTLTSVDAGIFGAAPCAAPPATGQTCTLPGNAFNLMNTGVGSTLSFTLRGNALNGPSTSPFVGTVTTQFSGLPYQSVLATLATGGSVDAAYSADFNVTLP